MKWPLVPRNADAALVSTGRAGDDSIKTDPLALWNSYCSNALIDDEERRRLHDIMEEEKKSRRIDIKEKMTKITKELTLINQHNGKGVDVTKYIRAIENDVENIHMTWTILSEAMKAKSQYDDKNIVDLEKYAVMVTGLLDKYITCSSESAQRYSSLSTIGSKPFASANSNSNETNANELKFRAEARLKAWSDMPKDEICERLNKGEQLHIDEWMPSSGTRKPLNVADAKAHVEFGYKLKQEGTEAYGSYQERKDLTSLRTAGLRFKQGIRLLESVEIDYSLVNGNNEELDKMQFEMDELESTFYRNHGIIVYHSGEYNECIESCNKAIRNRSDDYKARYRRGLAYLALSQIVEAKDDFVFLQKMADNHRANNAGKDGLKQLRDILVNWKADARSFMKKTMDNRVFSKGREAEDASIKQSLPCDESICRRYEPEDLDTLINNQQKLVYNLRSKCSLLSREDSILVLMELLEFYNRSDIIELMDRNRLESDFDAKRYIYRFRKDILPLIHKEVYEPILHDQIVEHVEEKATTNELLHRSAIVYCAEEKLEYFKNLKNTELLDGVINNPTANAEDIGMVTALWKTVNDVFWGDIQHLDEVN